MVLVRFSGWEEFVVFRIICGYSGDERMFSRAFCVCVCCFGVGYIGFCLSISVIFCVCKGLDSKSRVLGCFS